MRGQPRCPEHTRTNRRTQQAQVDAARPTAAGRGYDGAWREIRRNHLAAHPSCVECGAPATDVDHINSVREYPELRLAPSNVRSLCHPCHSSHTARTQGFARPKGQR